MLYFPQTRIELSVERPVAVGSTINAEGCALVNSLVAGRYGVKPSTGGAGEVLAGVSVNMVTTPLSAAIIEEAVIGAAKVINLGNTPLAASLFVYVKDTGVVLTAGANLAAVAPTVYWQDDTTTTIINVDASLIGKTVVVASRYAPTLVQQMALQGNIIPGGPAGAYLGQVGVITRGDVYTDQWNTAGNWATAVGVILGANGIFSPTTDVNARLQGVQIIELPSVSRGFLGLTINCPA